MGWRNKIAYLALSLAALFLLLELVSLPHLVRNCKLRGGITAKSSQP
jgi:hypothetical protein